LNNSVIAHSYDIKEHDCVENRTCECITIWDSDCYCENINNNNNNTTQQLCNCDSLLKDCWNFHVSLKDYNLSSSECLFPLLQKIPVTLVLNPTSHFDIELLNTWKEVMEVMHETVALQFLFNPSQEKTPRDKDLVINILCSLKYYTKYSLFFPFISCMEKYVNYYQNYSLEEFARSCAYGHLGSYDNIENCSKSEEGLELYEDNLKEAKEYPAPTIIINHSIYIPKNYYSVVLYLSEICSTNSNSSQSPTFPWWIFTFMACIVLTLLIVTWIAKSDASKNISSLFCSIFYEIDQDNQDNTAEEVLRLWQNGALGDEEDNDPPVAAQTPPNNVQELNNNNNNNSRSDEESDEDNYLFVVTTTKEEDKALLED